ncbi:hypothetical protein Thiowin_02006 [Thiorhodovibrio winogradskyi]|uniref:Zinc ribbon domain-containing protein n=1 Tax=Thiorhodovibrio winogradskyi TaxID=77007 RepID=A0ABZ0SAF1_9GAMM
MDRCPNCRARADGTTHCRRCGMELDRLAAIEQAAEQHLQIALRALASGQRPAAKTALHQAQGLKNQPLAAKLLGFIGVLDDAARVDFASDVTTQARPVPAEKAPPAAEARWLQW